VEAEGTSVVDDDAAAPPLAAAAAVVVVALDCLWNFLVGDDG